MSEAKVIPLPATSDLKGNKVPIYRKYKSGTEWQKIVTPSAVIHIVNTGTWWDITFQTSDEQIITAILLEKEALPCTRDEWEKIYHNAQWILNKLNTVQ